LYAYEGSVVVHDVDPLNKSDMTKNRIWQ